MQSPHLCREITLTGIRLEGFAIVVIDDDASVRSAMAMIFADWGCRVLEGESVASVEPDIQDGSFFPDIIVTDLHLSGSQSEPSVDDIHQFAGRIGFHGPIVVVTGDSGSTSRDLVRNKGWPLLIKPFSPGELCTVIAEVICSTMARP